MRVYEMEDDFIKFCIEARELFKENNEELDFFGLPVDLNTPLYENLNRSGFLKIYTVRDDGLLVGYCTFILQPHLQHKDHIQARQDVLFIKKEYRGKGVKFLTWCEQQLKDIGVSFIFRSVTKIKDWSLILKRLNYEEVETIYMKDLRTV